jgi:hypothetical protein
MKKNKYYIILILIIFFLNNVMASDNKYDSLIEIQIKDIATKYKYKKDTVRYLYNICAENKNESILFKSKLKLSENEYCEFCLCKLEKTLKRFRYEKGLYLNMTSEDAQAIGVDCISIFIERMQQRSGNFEKPNQIKSDFKDYNKFNSLYNKNNWSKIAINSIYGLCINNKALEDDFNKNGFDKKQFSSYCDCYVENIVNNIDYNWGVKNYDLYLEQLEIISADCVGK